MSFLKRLLFYFFHPLSFVERQQWKKLQKKQSFLSDEEYLKKAFKIKQGYCLNLESPKSINEKLQWLKLHDRNPFYHILADKYAVREFVKKRIGEQHLIPLYGVYNSPDEIVFSKLPNQFVLKCNHNSHKGVCICKDKNTLDVEMVKKELSEGLAQDPYIYGREWCYLDIPRKIVCEQLLKGDNGKGIADYKFFCFNGEPKFFLIATDREKKVKFDYYDMNKNHLPFKQGGPNANINIKDLDITEMVKIAKQLSRGFPHVRVDLYLVDGFVYFGEMTLYDSAGFSKYKPKKWDFILGDYLDLSWVKKNEQN